MRQVMRRMIIVLAAVMATVTSTTALGLDVPSFGTPAHRLGGMLSTSSDTLACDDSALSPDELGLRASYAWRRALVSRYYAFLVRFGRFHELNEICASALCAKLRQFSRNEKRAQTLTRRDEAGAEYSAAHSPFGDISPLEFAETVLMPKRREQQQNSLGGEGSVGQASSANKLRQQPRGIGRGIGIGQAKTGGDSFDWVSKGAVTPVRDQGALGTCYIFAAAGAVESQVAIHQGRNATISVEHALECDSSSASSGGEDEIADCGIFGGYARLVFAFWQRVGGFVPEAAFPYCAGTLSRKTLLPDCFPCMARGYQREECGSHDDLFCNASGTLGQESSTGVCSSERARSFVRENRAGRVTGWARVANSTSPSAIGAALQGSGPLTTLLDASALQLYRRGVADPWLCSKDAANHEVLLVGHGPGFLKAKNSWGAKWGEKGFFRIRPGKCGIDRHVTAVTIATSSYQVAS